jgi:hypothetical protein
VVAFYGAKRHIRLRFDSYIGRQEAKEKISDMFVEKSGEKDPIYWCCLEQQNSMVNQKDMLHHYVLDGSMMD